MSDECDNRISNLMYMVGRKKFEPLFESQQIANMRRELTNNLLTTLKNAHEYIRKDPYMARKYYEDAIPILEDIISILE